MIYDVRDLCFTYPGTDRQILKNVSLTLDHGEILSVLGPNGAGKTSLLNCMTGLLKPCSGDIILDGKKMKEMHPKDIAKIIGYVPQLHTPVFNYTVLDFVMMGRAPKLGMIQRPSDEDVDFCMQVLEEMGISKIADRSYMEISGGERQQTLIARAIVQEPQAILFDEPTAHLDFGNQQKVLTLIRKMASKGFAVIITTHNPDHALLLGDKTAIVSREGHLTSGPTDEIITERRLEEVYHTKIKMMEIPEIGRRACLISGL